MSPSWTLRDLTEYDLLLYQHVDQETVELDPYPTADESRTAVLYRWLHSIRTRHPKTTQHAGVAIQSEQWFRIALLAFSLLSGAGTAAALLQYQGDRLINISAYLGVIVGSQLLILLLLGFSLSLYRRRLPALYRALLPRVVRETQGLHSLPAWRWQFFIHFQQAGIFFNLGVILCTLWKVLTFDLAFGWATTLQVDENAMHQLVNALSTPWGRAFTPTPEHIKASQISLQDSLAGIDAKAVKSWWPFLLMCVGFYGVLPRVILSVLGSMQLRSILKHPPLHHAVSEKLFHNLTRTPLSFSTKDSTTESKHPSPFSALNPLKPQGPLTLRLDDDILPPDTKAAWSDRVAQRLNLTLSESDSETTGCLLIREAWQPPLEETLRKLRELRQQQGPQSDILLLLVGEPRPDHPDAFAAPEEPDVEVWTNRLSELRDPRLGLLLWKEADA
jgi:hypothetical protein